MSAIVEIIAFHKPEKLPNALDYIAGVILYRNTVCPVMDLRKKFGIGSGSAYPYRQIIIVNNSYGIVGIISDSVHEIKTPDSEKIKFLELSDTYRPAGLFTGILHHSGGNIGVLQLDTLLEDSGIYSVEQLEFANFMETGADTGSEGGSINESL